MSDAGNAHSGEAGFTLMEMLVAMSLFGMLTVALYGSLNFGTRVWERAEDTAIDHNRIRAAQNLLRNLLSQAYPLVTEAQGTARADFEGGRDGVLFLVAAPPDIAPGGFARVTFRTAMGEDGLALQYDIVPELGDMDRTPRTLISHIETLSFSYFGGAEYGQAGAWQEEWRERIGIPQLIRIHAEFPAAMGVVWPALIIATDIQADMGCVYDALTKFCRGY